MNNRLAIIGSSDLGQLIAYHAKQSCNYDVVGYYDDFNLDYCKDYAVKLITERLNDVVNQLK